ncbi:MAG: TetR/AcrR family transcriptional regulator [Anaerolineales bacterium]|nr:TetR/AcrR family transcriptional regulator [Anaerolineales bacterium]MDP7645255.1 TetR/AcrR family transcriptional regulator [Anaerolineales bacterium]HJO34364.1 TetR/AcrR family transcriptional regulator [Anaerolineales bacterium]
MNKKTLTKGARTRTALTNAALQCFAESGYHGASMRLIAERAGLKAVGGIYNHFSGKEEIFTEVVRIHHPVNQLALALADSDGVTLEALFRNAARRMVAQLGAGNGMVTVKLMFIEMVEFDGKHIAQLFEGLFPHVMRFMQRISLQQDELRKAPPPMIIRAFIGSIYAFFLTELLLAGTPITTTGDPDDLMDIFLHGALKAET